MTLSNIYYLHEIGGKKNQEDYIWPVPGTATLQDKFFIVCDGVGGSENGEIASRIIAESVGIDLLKNKDTEISQLFITKLIKEAIEKLKAYAIKHSLATDMATTFSLLAFQDERAIIAWCGDSRVYHLRKGETVYKTADHSLVASLVKSGEITEEEAQSHPQKNIILKAIRIDSEPAEIECHVIENIDAGDYFMLCTDGVLENIAENDLKFLLNKNETGEIDLVKSFQQFCFGKTKDNYSMYMLRVGGDVDETGKKEKKSNSMLVVAVMLLIALISAGAYFVNNKKLHKDANAGLTTTIDSSHVVNTTQIQDTALDKIINSSNTDSAKQVITKIINPDEKPVAIPAVQKNTTDTLVVLKKVARKSNDSLNVIKKKVFPKDSLTVEKKDTISSEPH